MSPIFDGIPINDTLLSTHYTRSLACQNKFTPPMEGRTIANRRRRYHFMVLLSYLDRPTSTAVKAVPTKYGKYLVNFPRLLFARPSDFATIAEGSSQMMILSIFCCSLAFRVSSLRRRDIVLPRGYLFALR